MATYAGMADQPLLIDRTLGVQSRSIEYNGNYNILALQNQIVGTHTDGGGEIRPPALENRYAGLWAPWETIGLDWFDKVHLIPRTKLEFGNIVSSISLEYEIFSGHRVPITLTAITNNAGAGTTLPNAPTPPEELPPFTSFLDPTSARLSKVKLRVQVGVDGVPTFDATIVFTFDTGEELTLELSGNRIALFDPVPEMDGYQETMSFLTDIIPSISGKEQRISLRNNPRQGFKAQYLLDTEERQRMQNTLFGWQTKLFALPVWTEAMKSTASASATDTTIAVETTTNLDFRVGGLAVVYESPTKYDVVVLSAVNANSLEFTTSPLLNSYSPSVTVIPLRLSYINGPVRVGRYRNNLEQFEIAFTSWDNDTGMFAGSTSGWTTYDGKIVFDDPNLTSGSVTSHELSQDLIVIDNKTGKFTQFSDWDRHKMTKQKGFVAQGRANIKKLKQLLLSVRGKQKSFYLPTEIDDLTPVATILNSGNTLDIAHTGFTRFVGDKGQPKGLIRLNFTDGTYLDREILSSTEVSSSVERLTVDVNWPADRTVDEIRRIQFLELHRFDTDEFTLRYPRVGVVTLVAPVKTVFA